MPAVSNIPLSSLVRAGRNANVVSPEKAAQLRENIDHFGFVQPMLVRHRPDGLVDLVDGHHRLTALQELGYTEVPESWLFFVDGLSDREVEILRLSMNSLRGDPELNLVGQILRDIQRDEPDFNLLLSGFPQAEIGELLQIPEVDTRFAAETLPDYSSDDGEPTTKVYDLVITFASAAELKAVRARLRKSAGKSKDLALALLKLLQIDRP